MSSSLPVSPEGPDRYSSANMSSARGETRAVSAYLPPSPPSRYTSIMQLIKDLLATGGSPVRPDPSTEELAATKAIFLFSEKNRPDTGMGGTLDDQEIEYRVEYNLWCYYFGNTPFPGDAPSAPPPPPPMSIRARGINTALVELLGAQKDFGPDYVPQMGWNPQTGEPWLSVRCYARNGYPALSGPYNEFTREVEKMVPEFKVFFMRYKREQYVLIWPEFASRLTLSLPSSWERFAKFRYFLETWATFRGELPHINDACRDWLRTPYQERKSLELPDGFRLDYNYVAAKAELVGNAQGPQAEPRMYDSWRPSERRDSNRTDDSGYKGMDDSQRGGDGRALDRSDHYDTHDARPRNARRDTRARYDDREMLHEDIDLYRESPRRKQVEEQRDQEYRLRSREAFGRNPSAERRAGARDRSSSPRSRPEERYRPENRRNDSWDARELSRNSPVRLWSDGYESLIRDRRRDL